ncbi:MAG: hypothetical protein JXQ72_00630 [Anaerolineae bacterium]|nr:hypothetical protein [Anaerolineae bacterium]
MVHNPTFRRALRALAHPAVVGAVILLLINDHILKHTYPSWWTGKLSDVAGLIFAPLIVACLLAWVIPSRPWRDAVVGWLAFGLTGLIFALTKTVPAVNALVTDLWAAASGLDSVLLRDPTDLLALPALWIGWRVWQQAADHPRPATYAHRTLTARGRVVLLLGALATMATTVPEQERGIWCVYWDDPLLYALGDSFLYEDRYVSDSSYFSKDGGLTWEETKNQSIQHYCQRHKSPWYLSIPEERMTYRFQPGDSIDRWDIDQRDWVEEYDLSEHEAQVIYVEKIHSDVDHDYAWDGQYRPRSAVYHSKTGHIVAAMGYHGVLVRIADGQWQQITIGPYDWPLVDRSLDGWIEIAKALFREELWISLALLFLIPATLTFRWCEPEDSDYKRNQGGGVFLLTATWLVWCGAILLMSPLASPLVNLSSCRGNTILVCVVLAVISTLVVRGVSVRSAYAIYVLITTTLVGISLYWIPYILWVQARIASLETTQTFAIGLVAATVAWGYVMLRVPWARYDVKKKRSAKKPPRLLDDFSPPDVPPE